MTNKNKINNTDILQQEITRLLMKEPSDKVVEIVDNDDNDDNVTSTTTLNEPSSSIVSRDKTYKDAIEMVVNGQLMLVIPKRLAEFKPITKESIKEFEGGSYSLNKKFSDIVLAARLRLNLSQDVVAKDMVMSQSNYAKLELGKVQWTLDRCWKVSQLLGIKFPECLER